MAQYGLEQQSVLMCVHETVTECFDRICGNICFSELESKHDFVVKMKDLVQSLPRSVVIVMRYLFAFLNQ
jgi:hypothetical protein